MGGLSFHENISKTIIQKYDILNEIEK